MVMMTERELLAQGVKRALLRKGWTEYDLARRLNLGGNTTYRWTRGDSRPSPANLRRVCAVLEVNETDLREGLPGDIFDEVA
jgi:transcriptional regulator with XRE-family HTH domain